MTPSISDRVSPNSIKVGGWLFRHRTSLPLPIAAAILLIPPDETPVPLGAVLVGVVITLGGEVIRLWGVHHIGVISRTRSDRLGPLVDTGPFAYTRNPLYLGNILLWVGFAVTAGLLWLAPIAFALLAVEYHWIVRWEEALLVARLGDAYRAYAQEVPRWWPKPRRPDYGQTTDSQTMTGLTIVRPVISQTLFSERGTLIAIVFGYLLLWLKARF